MYKQNINRDIEIKKKLTVTREEAGGDKWCKKGEGSSRNMYKGQVEKAKGCRIEGARWGWLGWEGVVGGKWRQLNLNNN